jgi:ferredoxin-fold anticodon binding domain-containing protein
LTIDEATRQIKLATGDPAFIQTEVEHTLVVDLVDYEGLITPLRETFLVTIEACEVVSITEGTQITEQTYFIGDTAVTIPIVGYTTEPACGYDISYEVLSVDDTTAFLTLDQETETLTV